ncbi:MAG TPA: MauE/DoxX family redox-associated membrane protein [Candidatus Babeliales bacterium]|nr:MauE/DoxX family redox-associated membrane protein [Candidatus Babeliales bacterium]
MKMHNSNPTAGITLKSFAPLFFILSIILLFTVLRRFIYGWNIIDATNDFMGSFFIVFSLFKIYNLHGFVEAFSMYDLIAKRSIAYAYIYPFIEFCLGIAYLTGIYPIATNAITLFLMSVGSIGVAYELAQHKEIICACLGAVFKIPMTYVTLLEDLSMAIMALVMLIYYYR